MNTSDNSSDKFAQHVATARQILSRIAARWTVAEQVRGGAGTIPAVATLILPQAEWDTLTKDEQISLTFYAESLIDDVRKNPSKYMTISSTAPIYQSMLNNFRRIRDGYWEIVIGRIQDRDAMSVMVDKSLVRGDAYWDSEQDKFGIRASDFRQED